ncbi:hypothetical protein [Pseudomonas sp. P1.31]|jgi:hypothetical protein|uniref:hypothetical protein n=1 Tax=Pseudomonas sp. P1.31 TaxID=1699311 RepID=UPI00069DC354|nr:hypothetical protein [Pseudomonas sp. P1.31]
MPHTSLQNLNTANLTCPFAEQTVRSLEVFDLLCPGLALHATLYVITGEADDVLTALRQADAEAANAILCQPNISNWWRSPHVYAQRHQQRLQAAANARAQMYALGNEEHAAKLVRLGKVMEAACQGTHLRRIAQIPEWFLYLAIDALSNTCTDLKGHCRTRMPANWNFNLLCQILAADDMSPLYALLLMLERRDNLYWRDFDALLEWPDLAEFLLENPAMTRCLINELSISGRLSLLKVFEMHPALAQTYADVMVQLAVVGDRRVRVVAAPQVIALPLPNKLPHLRQLMNHGTESERTRAVKVLAHNGEAVRKVFQARLKVEGAKPVLKALNHALAQKVKA